MSTNKKGQLLYPDYDVQQIIQFYREKLEREGEKRSNLTSSVLNSLIRDAKIALELEDWLSREYPSLYKQFLTRNETPTVSN